MNIILKALLVVIISATSVFLTNCSDDGPVSGNDSGDHVKNTRYSASDTYSDEIAVTAQTRLRLEGVNGTIEITEAVGSGAVTIDAEKIVKSESTVDAEAHLQELEVNVQVLNDEILIQTEQPEQSGGRSYVINYIITMPQDLDVHIFSVNGRVVLNDIVGNVFVDLGNGDIDGDVTVEQDGVVDLSVVNGSIDLSVPVNLSADLTARVVNGSISVSNLDLHDIVKRFNYLSGTSGDGRGTVHLRATNGEIAVNGF